ncbi:MAG: histidine phosphatase family protein [Pseudomonadota bacterium]
MIYLIRHGEAAASWGTHPNPGLSETGRTQAEAVAMLLKDVAISTIHSSPMQRCQETAEAFARLSGIDLVIEPKVTEIPTPQEVDDRVSWLQQLMSGNWSDAPELVQSWRRDLIETVSALPDETVVFTHFVAINAIVGHLEGSDSVTVFRPNYCSQTKLQRQGDRMTLVERGESLVTKVL